MTRRATGGRWTPVLASIAVALLAAGCADAPTAGQPDAPAPDPAVAATDPSTGAAVPAPAPDPDGDGTGVVPEGFTTVQARITAADGEVCEVCLWLADDGPERARGLMGVTDLGDAAGMVFQFDEAHRGSFYMFQTPTPLSIAWFGVDGRHVGSTDMEPCLDTPAGDCTLYSPDAEYTTAIEVFAGGLDALGIGPGSNVELLEGSESDRCPVAPATP
jgi:uncharacterized membrane protein (UPF0127 family)